MRSRSQSVGKEAPFYTDNEDALRADDTLGIWAVADGAGGTGVYAGEWAQHLLHQLPITPVRDVTTLASWLDSHWETFYNVYQPQAQANYLIEQKFMQEGSSATLSCLHYNSDQLHWMVYGDAIALCFCAASNQVRASTTDIPQFEAAPHLINWQMALYSDGFLSGIWSHQPGQQYALLSDALGQYVLMAHAALQKENEPLYELAKQPTRLGYQAQVHLSYWSGKNACFGKAVWSPLRAALHSSDHFLRYTQQLRRQQLLSADDYTCVLIED